MAYARFGGDSDVYVFFNNAGYYECCGCRLGGWPMLDTPGEMLAHLSEHQRAGHKVPAEAIEALKAEQVELEREGGDA